MEKFLQKCDGLPLGIIEINIMRVFSASYKDLPYHLKYCFLYMSIFPENNPVKRRRLIRLWIAEGFVIEERGKTLEEVGEEYLNELICRSLIKANEMDFDERPITVGDQKETWLTNPGAYPSRRETFIRTGNFDVSQDLTCVRTFFSFSTGVQGTKGIDTLKNLQKLSFVKASGQHRMSRKHRMIQGLDNITQLRKLGIVELAEEHGASLCLSIEKMPNLHSLNVTSLNKEEPLELDAMTNPSPLLQRLYLRGPLERFPRWVSSLHDLERIRLKWSSLTENPIAALQNLPNLTELQLLDAYTGTQLDFNSGKFQKLKILDLEQLKQLRFIIMEDGTLPCLQKLIIRQCNELEPVPVGIDRLHHLNEQHLCDMPEKFVAQLKKNGGQFRRLGLFVLVEVISQQKNIIPVSDSLHNLVLDLFVWLSFQLEDLFPDRELALSQRAICSMLIEGFLERGGWRQPMASSMPSRISSTSLLSHKQDLTANTCYFLVVSITNIYLPILLAIKPSIKLKLSEEKFRASDAAVFL
ncbi:Disease resistance protein RPM1 [Vitis vinifera]|uniref:Disease resistance protein RPM1 n=1 Tax=Vitis vinifera TaxID=29760 RepID=A0A438F6Z5_VITVI|nr:Disease resistance protein RPM1 [Vitis vinifera]